MNIQNLIANNIVLNDVTKEEIEPLIQEVQTNLDGDYCIPCFALAKKLHASPIIIANNIKDNFKSNELIEKIEVVNGYVNFFVNKPEFIKQVLIEMTNTKEFFSSKEYFGKRLCIDYSSVNLAKYMHIGHLSTTMIGESLARIYTALGYDIIRINYIGDYGTPFGKMVYAFLNWGNNSDLEKGGVGYLQELYVEFCKRAEEDEKLEEYAREYFKKIEMLDPEAYTIYRRFIDISKQEAKELLDNLGVKFDSWKGESSYTSQLNGIVKELQAKNLLEESQGAKIVNLEEYNLGACLIQKSDGSSLYATRDIAAAIDRFNEYHFDKMIYVTAVQQKLHFEQFFKVLELMGYDFSSNLTHVYYGMFSLPNGKIASRKGKQATLRDLFDYSYNKAYSIVKDRNFNIETKENVAQKIAMSALKFNALKNERIKDAIFDIENCFNFDGDTSAYMQYSYARICSILRKANISNFDKINYNYLTSTECFNLIFATNNFLSTVRKAYASNEPSIISKYALDLCKLANKFYMSEKVVTENNEETIAKAFLLTNVRNALKEAFNLICLETVEEM